MATPNVLIIYTDDQGTIDAGCYGSPDLSTPHLDALAERGTRFTQAYAHTVCCPSRAALLTGRYPQRCGVTDWCSNHPRQQPYMTEMHADAPTIASLLKAQGYTTGLVGKWHLGAGHDHTPLDFGFDHFYGHRCGFIDNYRHMFLHSNPGQPPFHDLWRDREEVFETGAYFPDQMTREARSFLEANRERPFFLYLPFNLPHYPYQPDPEYVERYRDLPMPRSLYAAMVSTVDERIGRVMAKLDELGLRENTLVIYMSDNGHSTEYNEAWGWQYGAHGGGGDTGQWRGAKASFLEGGIRVPAIISQPGQMPEGEVRDQIITNMDILPTICSVTGTPLPDARPDGFDLAPVIADADSPSGYAGRPLCFQWQDQWMVRDDNWKLIVNGKDTTGEFSAHPEGNRVLDSPHLGRLDEDEPELANHADAHADVVTRLTEAHAAWHTEVTP